MESENTRSSKGSFFNTAWYRLGTWRQLLPFGAAQRPPRFQFHEARRLMQACLDGVGGEIAVRSRAAELGYMYLTLSRSEKCEFLNLLMEEFDVDRAAMSRACNDYLAEPGTATYAALQRATQPSRLEVLKRLNSLPDGFTFLVNLRADLIEFLEEAPSLASLDHDLRALLEGWFDIGLLTFERITWRSSAALLERLVEYEAVHRIRSWQDLKKRLDVDRRCYAFFHPKMPGDPLIFVEVALTKGIPTNVHALLDQKAPSIDAQEADTAVFYSISNTQRGLRGISFGSFLLKRVMEDLATHLPHLKHHVTISPIPGFRSWLQRVYEEHRDAFFTTEEREALGSVFEASGSDAGLAGLLQTPHWAKDEDLVALLEEPLLDMCATYLLATRSDGKPLDPVARFHLTNGASIWRLNFLADRTRTGMEQSLGVMVNYSYESDKLERNHERLFREGKIPSAPDVTRRASRRLKALSLP